MKTTSWWRRLLHKQRAETELDSELQFHFESLVADKIRAGATESEARRTARLEFGGLDQVKEECRDARGTRWVGDILQDTLFALRTLRKNPGFTITAIATLALGIGANTAIFAVVNAVLLKPLTYPDPDRIVQFQEVYAGGQSGISSPRHFNLWRQQLSVFQDVSAHWLDHVNLTGGSDSELVAEARVTADFFRLYGAPVLHGRTFTHDEDRPNGVRVVVLSHGLWTRRFGSNPEIVGKTILLSDAPYEIVGILGPGFNTEQFDQQPDLWVPFQIEPGSTALDSRLCIVTGRLAPGTTIGMARAKLLIVEDEYRRIFRGTKRVTDSVTVQPLRDAIVGDVRPALLVLIGAVSFVLLIACANVANLLLVRAAGRKREIAIRAAVGASRGRIARQLLTESVALALIGGALGLTLGMICIHAMLAVYPSTPLGVAINPINIPRIGQAGSAVALDWRVVAFTFLVSVVTGLFFGMLPAFRVSGSDLNSPLKESSGRSGSGFRQNKTLSLLVVSEVTLALVLLIGAALLIRSSLALRAVKPGFDTHNVLTMQMSLASARSDQSAGVDQLVRAGIQRVGALPGVETTAISCCLPLETVWQLPFIISGRALAGRYHGFVGSTFVSAGYFEALKIPVLHGRPFTDQDNAAAPGVVIINQAMARLGWPKGDPLNDRLLIGRTLGPEYERDPIRQIVGIVGDVRDVALNRSPRPAMYVPLAQVPDGVKAAELSLLPIAWVVRTRGEPHALASRIENELRQASGGLPIARTRSMDEVAVQSTARTRLNMYLMTTFGATALLLAAIGIYGLMAYSVQQRTSELGIRLALGAEPSTVRNMVLFQGMRLAIIGTAIGIATAWGLTRLLASFLFGVQPRDPITFIVVPIILGAVALLGCYLPAHRATRINPMEVMRWE